MEKFARQAQAAGEQLKAGQEKKLEALLSSGASGAALKDNESCGPSRPDNG